MPEPLCLGQGRDTFKIDISGCKQSPKEELIGGLGSFVLSIGGIFAVAAIKNGSSSSSESSSTSSQEAQYAAIVSQLMTPEGLNSVRLAESEFQGQLEQELEVLEQVLNQDNYGEENLYSDKKENTSSDAYNAYADAITSKTNAEAKIKELNNQRDRDLADIETLKTQADMDISNTVTNGRKTITVENLVPGAFMDAFEAAKNSHNGCKRIEDANPDDPIKYETQRKEVAEYESLLALEGDCKKRDEMIKAREDAKDKIDKLKEQYGTQLDGRGGTHGKAIKAQEDSIKRAEETISNTQNLHPKVVTDYTNNQALDAKEKLYDQLRTKYGMTQEKANDGSTNYTLKRAGQADHRKLVLQKAISMGREINSLIRKADSLISEVTLLQSNIEKFNEKDGTLWSRSKLRDIFVKGDKGKEQRAAKRNKSASKERLKTKQTELQSTVSRLVLLQSQRKAFMDEAAAQSSAATSSTTSASTSTTGTTT